VPCVRQEGFAKLAPSAPGISRACTLIVSALARTARSAATDAKTGSSSMTPVHTDLQREVAALLVEALNLDVAPEAIDPEAPLYGEGLGLDSIDILEVALVVSQRYGFQLRSDDEDNVRIFTSLASLTEHIAAHRIA
jgi:acyl carrier protein